MICHFDYDSMLAPTYAILFFWHTGRWCYSMCSIMLIAEKVPTSSIQTYLCLVLHWMVPNVFLVFNYEKQEMGNGWKHEQPRSGKERKLQVDLGKCRKWGSMVVGELMSVNGFS